MSKDNDPLGRTPVNDESLRLTVFARFIKLEESATRTRMWIAIVALELLVLIALEVTR